MNNWSSNLVLVTIATNMAGHWYRHQAWWRGCELGGLCGGAGVTKVAVMTASQWTFGGVRDRWSQFYLSLEDDLMKTFWFRNVWKDKSSERLNYVPDEAIKISHINASGWKQLKNVSKETALTTLVNKSFNWHEQTTWDHLCTTLWCRTWLARNHLYDSCTIGHR